MITELALLRALLLASMIVGPLGTRCLFPTPSRRRDLAHGCAVLCAAVGLYGPWPMLCVGWLAFCAAMFALFLRVRARAPWSARVLAASVPFVFSNVAAAWLVGGANDLALLGYDVHFSYYAALHGNVLGWTLIGALATLADQDSPQRAIYLASVFVCLVSFFAIALGIDQLRVLKTIGVVGFSIAIPTCQLAFLRSVRSHDRRAFLLGCVSFAGLLFTMVLAWQHELAAPMLPWVAGIRPMVAVHGVLNAVIVAPCFVLAVLYARCGTRANAVSSPGGGTTARQVRATSGRLGR